MPEWGIIILVISVIIIFVIAIYVPILYRIRSAKFKKERTIDRKITVDKPNDHHRHLLIIRKVT